MSETKSGIVKVKLFDENTKEMTTFEPLPPGKYGFVVLGASRNDKPADPAAGKAARIQAVLKAKITEAPDPDNVGKERTMFWQLPNEDDVNKKGTDSYFHRLWKAVADVKPDAVKSDQLDFDRLAGLQFECDVTHREWQGRMKEDYGFANILGVAERTVEGPAMFDGK